MSETQTESPNLPADPVNPPSDPVTRGENPVSSTSSPDISNGSPTSNGSVNPNPPTTTAKPPSTLNSATGSSQPNSAAIASALPTLVQKTSSLEKNQTKFFSALKQGVAQRKQLAIEIDKRLTSLQSELDDTRLSFKTLLDRKFSHVISKAQEIFQECQLLVEDMSEQIAQVNQNRTFDSEAQSASFNQFRSSANKLIKQSSSKLESKIQFLTTQTLNLQKQQQHFTLSNTAPPVDPKIFHTLISSLQTQKKLLLAGRLQIENHQQAMNDQIQVIQNSIQHLSEDTQKKSINSEFLANNTADLTLNTPQAPIIFFGLFIFFSILFFFSI